jgi:hypothetical protein
MFLPERTAESEIGWRELFLAGALMVRNCAAQLRAAAVAPGRCDSARIALDTAPASVPLSLDHAPDRQG